MVPPEDNIRKRGGEAEDPRRGASDLEPHRSVRPDVSYDGGLVQASPVHLQKRTYGAPARLLVEAVPLHFDRQERHELQLDASGDRCAPLRRARLDVPGGAGQPAERGSRRLQVRHDTDVASGQRADNTGLHKTEKAFLQQARRRDRREVFGDGRIRSASEILPARRGGGPAPRNRHTACKACRRQRKDEKK